MVIGASTMTEGLTLSEGHEHRLLDLLEMFRK